MGQPVVAHRAVIAFDISILLRLSRLDEVDANAAFGGPGQRHGADVLRAVIAANDLGFATPFDDPVEAADDAFGRQGEIDLDAESLTIVVVDHIEQPDASAVGQLVMHEVHRPGVVDLCRHGQRQRLFPHQPMAWLDPQVQFQFAIDPVDALVVPFKPLHVAQIQEAQAEAPVALLVGQAYQPVSHDSIFRVELGAIAIAGLANAKCLTGQSYGG